LNIFISGGTGFIGSRLALACLERGHSVKVLGQVNTPAEVANRTLLEKEGADVILASVMDREVLLQELKGADYVFHLAAAQHEISVPDQRFRDVNVRGTVNMLEASVNAGVKRFIHGSTIGVYGSSMDGNVIDEESPLQPDNIYGETKAEGEKAVLSFADRLPVVIIRIPETYGPGDRRLLKLFKTIGKNRFFLIGDGRNLHHLIYIDDLVESFFLAADSSDSVGNVFVVAGREAVTTREMASVIAEQMGTNIPGVHAPLSLFLLLATIIEKTCRPMGIAPPIHRRRMDFFRKSFSFSIGKAERILKFSPKVSFREGVFHTARWYKEMGYLDGTDTVHERKAGPEDPVAGKVPRIALTAKTESFDSFWEAPKNIEKGFVSFSTFYRHNYLKYIPEDRDCRILVISCGPGYFVDLLTKEGYTSVLGIDSHPEKIAHASRRNLNCRVEHAFDFLEDTEDSYDVIMAEQEVNHLTKDEILYFLRLCRGRLRANGILLVHSLNGANPITGAEALAQNFDHYNTFTEYSLRQVLEYAGFRNVRVIPLNLYVFYRNPLNYVAMLVHWINTLRFRFHFILYGKSNRIFTKKIGAICRKVEGSQRQDLES